MPKFKNRLIINVYNENANYVSYALHELGYISEYKDHTQYINGYLVTENTGVYYTTFGRGFDISNPDYINCGSNIELFLALASMRDDSDKYQLFVSDTACSWVNIGMWRNKGDFEFCLVDDYRMGEPEFSNSIPPAHKASIDEIKNYLLLNPDYKPYRHWYEKTSIDAILKSMNDLANKIIKEDKYVIYANKDIYETLKTQSIGGYTYENENDGFFVMFQQRPVNVFLNNNFNLCKLMMFKNDRPFIMVDNNNIIHKVEGKNDETDKGTENKN